MTDVQNGINFDEYYLSCGHIQTIDKQDNSNNKDKKSFDIDNKKGMVEDIINEFYTTCNICGLTARRINELEITNIMHILIKENIIKDYLTKYQSISLKKE